MNNNNSSRADDDLSQGKHPVVSDALAKNSRQLLYAHLYNYLLENNLHDTAKILLKEADVPLSTPLDEDDDPNNKNQDNEESPGVKMLMTSPDTFLLEWWQSLWALHSYVKETSAIQQQQQQQHMTSMNGLNAANAGAATAATAASVGSGPGALGAPGAGFNSFAQVQLGGGPNQFVPTVPPPRMAANQHQSIPKSNNSPIGGQNTNHSNTNNNNTNNNSTNNTPSNTTNTINNNTNNVSSPSNNARQHVPTPQQVLQSPLPQSAHGTPHPSQNMNVPSPAPNSGMIPMQQIPSQQQAAQQHHHHQQQQQQQQQLQHHQSQVPQVPGSTGPQNEHLTPQSHGRTPVVPQQQPTTQNQQNLQQAHVPVSSQQRQPQEQWQFNKFQQQLQAQELQQRVQMQKLQLNNQYNFQQLPLQQQQLFLNQQRFQAAQTQAMAQQARNQAMNRGNAGAGAAGQVPPNALQAQMLLQQQQQQQPPMGMPQPGSNMGTPTSQHPPPLTLQQQQQQQARSNPNPNFNGKPQANGIPSGMPPQQQGPQGPHPPQGVDNGLRGDNSTALHDYQMQLMMLENQTKGATGGAPGNNGAGAGAPLPPNGANGANGSKSRGESIGIDPLQQDPLATQQFMDLFNANEFGGAGQNSWGNSTGNVGNGNGIRNGSQGNLGIDDLNVDLGVGFPNGGFMNGF